MSEVIAQDIKYKPQQFAPIVPTFLPRKKSPLHQKQSLIQKIQLLTNSNDKLQVKQESLQNTVFDLRKLIELTRKQGEQTVEILHSEIQQLQQRKQRAQAALKYSLRDGNHHQKCMLFWNEFL